MMLGMERAIMADISEPSTNGQRLPTELADVLSSGSLDTFEVSTQDFKDQFDEDILQALNVLDGDRWRGRRSERRVQPHRAPEVREGRIARNRCREEDTGGIFPALGSSRQHAQEHGTPTLSNAGNRAVHRDLLSTGR